MYLATADQIREADRIMIEDLGFPGILLMETAGRKCAEYLLHTYGPSAAYVILAGPGNNGGDGLVMARYLHLAHADVRVVLARPGEQYSGDAKTAWKALQGSGVRIDEYKDQMWIDDYGPADHVRQGKDPGTLPLKGNEVIIDALLGTGASGKLRGNVAKMVEALESYTGPRVAVDLPTGLDADTGEEPSDFFAVDTTLSFELPKVALAVFPAAKYAGNVVVIKLGMYGDVERYFRKDIQRRWLSGDVLREGLHARNRHTHKGTYGKALLIGGCMDYAGAIALSAHAAVAIGTGLVTILGPKATREAVFAMGAEVMVKNAHGNLLTTVDVEDHREFLQGKTWGIGPGMGQEKETALFLEELLKIAETPVVLDADALNIIAEHPHLWKYVPAKSILTPHPGEMARLTGDEEQNRSRLEVAEHFAREHNCVLVLKGPDTIVAAPDGRTFVNRTGNPGMATGGSGDVLTGAITGLLAQGHEPALAAAYAVYLHGLAGDMAAEESGEAGVRAGAILRNLGPAFQMVLDEQEPEIDIL